LFYTPYSKLNLAFALAKFLSVHVLNLLVVEGLHTTRKVGIITAVMAVVVDTEVAADLRDIPGEEEERW
jgi:hypothetical protein